VQETFGQILTFNKPAVGRESETHPAFGQCDRNFCRYDIRTFIPGGIFFFTVTRLERRRERE
jgi:hypothetical protein